MKLKRTILLLFLLVGSLMYSKAQNNAEEVENTFNALCELFEKNYASFEEKGIDWKAIEQKYRSQLNDDLSPEAFFDLLSQMLAPLHDDHVNLIARDIDKGFTAKRPSRIIKELSSIDGKNRRQAFNEMIEQTLKSNGFKPLKELGPKYDNRALFTYSDNSTWGYLRFTRSFSSKSSLGLSTVDKLLEEIFSSFKDLEGLIIDIRFNMGGDDRFSAKVAGRFIEQKTLSYYKQTRKDGVFGDLKQRYIQPAGNAKFLKPVILLTNDKTVSAADVLSLMMSQLPRVSLIGEPSNGAFSDLYSRKLPNGWTLTLSNQRYLSLSKDNYEGKGVPVDIKVENTLEDINKKRDSVILEALKYLAK